MAVDDYGLSFTRPDWVTRYLLQFEKLFMSSYHEGGWGRNHDVITLWHPTDPRDVDCNSPVAEIEVAVGGEKKIIKGFKSLFSKNR